MSMMNYCKWKPVALMILVNLALALANLLLKKVLSEGMSFLTIITYRQLVSAFFLSPIAFFYERKSRLEGDINILCLLFLSALVGVTFTQYLFLLGLGYTSATFSCAFLNMVPIFTFIMALPFGIEKVNLRSMSGNAKVLGSLICIGGALLLGLYRGEPLTSINPNKSQTPPNYNNNNSSSKTLLSSSPPPSSPSQWGVGSVLLTGGCLLWSSWFLIQARISKRYPFQYSSTAILSSFGAIQSAILNLIINRKNNNPAAIWILHGVGGIRLVLRGNVMVCERKRAGFYSGIYTPHSDICGHS
ncbi:WAT1-related protein At4g01440-like isoform X3 [Prosopis cineraria]|uniref:WAT1-related protein At4g01440-like isoform X3 n=1 Tax=Prosopis cineraria TaxID=364024 RepID=UPI00240EB437|nr:WAT1-related protein At4g01440-like isoform X3 [Prosopis cineraria]